MYKVIILLIYLSGCCNCDVEQPLNNNKDTMNKIEFEGGYVQLYDSAINYKKLVTDIASITRGKTESTNIESLYNRLLVESAGQPSVPFEYVGVRVEVFGIGGDIIHTNCGSINQVDFINKVLRYGYLTTCNDDMDIEYYLYTNLRTLLKAGFNIHNIEFNTKEVLEDFKIVVGKVPYKVFTHIYKHRTLKPTEIEWNEYEFSAICETSRNARYLKNLEYWYPSWWSNGYKSIMIEHDRSNTNLLIDEVDTGDLTPEEATMELNRRVFVTFGICGWVQDPDKWNNLFAVRGEGSNTQNITKLTVDNIKKLIYG